MRMILMNRNAQINEVGITKDEPWRLITAPAAREYVPALSQPIFPDRDEIYKVLSVYKPPILIGPVAGFLVDYFTCKNTAITNFRVSVFKGLNQHNDPEWLMLQWDESELKDEVFAIFKVNTKAGLSSTLVHSGHGGRQPGGQRWANSLFAWWVLTMEDLKELLVAGRQVLGVMNLADQEMVEKFFDPAQTDCSVQQYAPPIIFWRLISRLTLFAEILHPTLSRLEKWVAHFDSTAFLSEQLSCQAGVFLLNLFLT